MIGKCSKCGTFRRLNEMQAGVCQYPFQCVAVVKEAIEFLEYSELTECAHCGEFTEAEHDCGGGDED